MEGPGNDAVIDCVELRRLQRIRVGAGRCDEVVGYLNGPSKAGEFVQSLVVAETSPDLLEEKARKAEDRFVKVVPNMIELQMFDVTERAL